MGSEGLAWPYKLSADEVAALLRKVAPIPVAMATAVSLYTLYQLALGVGHRWVTFGLFATVTSVFHCALASL